MPKRTLAFASALTLAALPAFAETPIDRTDPNATAAAVITALLRQDGPGVASLFNEVNQRDVPEFEALAPDDPDWATLWSDWRQAGLDVFDGTLLPARYSSDDAREVVVPFALDLNESAAPLSGNCVDMQPCRYLVLVLTLDEPGDTSWGFEDINGYSIPRYRAAPNAN